MPVCVIKVTMMMKTWSSCRGAASVFVPEHRSAAVIMSVTVRDGTNVFTAAGTPNPQTQRKPHRRSCLHL